MPNLLSNLFGYRSTAQEVTAGLDLTGKTAVVTGCNAGIGYETMRTLLMCGANVLGLARNTEKAERACNAVTKPGVKGRALPFACDHTKFSSVVACADAIQQLAISIDILICNAGVYFIPRLELAEGLEKQFVVNHLSHFILVNRLLDQVKSAQQGRIVIVGSFAYQWAPEVGIEFDNLSGQTGYDPTRTYGQSKLANGLFARELSHRLSDTLVTTNVVHPGWVMTEAMRSHLVLQHSDLVDSEKAKSPEQGAATTCYVATSPDLATVNGAYFEDCNIAEAGGHMCDDAMAARLWAVSEKLTRGYLPGLD